MAIEQANIQIKELSKQSRELSQKAKEIVNAIYDLKAVNPNIAPPPAKLLNMIEAKAKVVVEALEALRK